MKQLRNERSIESVSNESEVAEDKETEDAKEEETDGENVEDEAVESDEPETSEIKVSGINEKVQRVLDKVLSKLKRVDQKLQVHTNGHITRYNRW